MKTMTIPRARSLPKRKYNNDGGLFSQQKKLLTTAKFQSYIAISETKGFVQSQTLSH
ncbi:MAG TPA: hypothetical protein VEY09_19780 [Pyrinomonadaceae bacterium]|nr:hypothetical protein [Pyrinomonadaceae bacterium]